LPSSKSSSKLSEAFSIKAIYKKIIPMGYDNSFHQIIELSNRCLPWQRLQRMIEEH